MHTFSLKKILTHNRYIDKKITRRLVKLIPFICATIFLMFAINSIIDAKLFLCIVLFSIYHWCSVHLLYKECNQQKSDIKQLKLKVNKLKKVNVEGYSDFDIVIKACKKIEHMLIHKLSANLLLSRTLGMKPCAIATGIGFYINNSVKNYNFLSKQIQNMNKKNKLKNIDLKFPSLLKHLLWSIARTRNRLIHDYRCHSLNETIDKMTKIRFTKMVTKCSTHIKETAKDMRKMKQILFDCGNEKASSKEK